MRLLFNAMTSQLLNPDNCPRCGKNKILTDESTKERVCGKCGFVVSEKTTELGPEWRSFSEDTGTSKTRTGLPTSLTMPDQGLSTIINPQNRDATGKPLTGYMKSMIDRLRTWDYRSQVNSPAEKNFRKAFDELNRLKDKLALSNSVVEKAAYIYRKGIEKRLGPGRSISSLIAASLYAACRDTGTPRTLNDFAQHANLKRKDISRSYRLLVRELELIMPVFDSNLCISRIASSLGITEKTKRHAIKILKTAQKTQESAGKDPMGLASAALYLSCIINGENITQHSISQVSGVTEVTIRNRFKGLKLDRYNAAEANPIGSFPADSWVF